MAYGAPDYSNVKGDEGIFVITDLGELAAMLGCPSVFHRSGNIVYLDRFEHGHAAWQKTTSGTGAGVATVTTYPFTGAFSCELTGGSDGLKYAGISRYLGVLPSQQLGLEIAVMFRSEFDNFIMWLQYENEAATHQAFIKLSDADDSIYVYRNNNDYAKFGVLPPSILYYGLYHRMKLIADFDGSAYFRFLYDDQNFDLSDYVIGSTSNSGIPGLKITLGLYSRAGENDKAQVGVSILTQREPVP